MPKIIEGMLVTMKRTPAIALSVFMALPLAMSLSLAAFSAHTDDETCRKLQPGRLESACEIKGEADAFVARGRDLSKRMKAQIAEAEKLRDEAIKLEVEALAIGVNRVSNQGTLIAQASTTPAPTTPTAEAKPVDASGNSSTPGTASEKPVDGAANDKSGGTAGGASGTGSGTGAGTDAAAAKNDEKDKQERLTGRASELQTLPMPNIPLVKLKGAQLQQAIKQFNADVEQFKIHANEYNKKYALFRSQIGECHAARGAFDALHKKYEMHTTAYHLNNIPPPRLCPPMAGSVAEANSIAAQLRSDQMRAMRADGQLRQEETRLRELEGMQGAADALVVKSGERDRREREIAGEFGKLRQEYDLLEIERKTIEHSKGGGKASAPVVRPYVSGKVKKGK